MLYFVQSPATGLVKIGFTDDIQHRFGSLCSRMDENLLPLGMLVGGKLVEGQLHAMFGSHRVFGEWFLPCDAMRDMVQQHCKKMEVVHVRLGMRVVPELVYGWPAHSMRVRQILAGSAPAFKMMPMWKRERDPNPLPLPCCPLLEPRS